ncbi:MAG: aminopeptidase P family protein [Chloroflexi bacterium]|nr:aminopeptidase P family protein [Chloroflexota bacterium]
MFTRPFSDAEYARRLERTRRIMAERGIDVLLLYAPESMNYLTGYDSFGYFAYQCLIVPIEGELTIQVRKPDVALAQDTSNVRDVRVWLDSQKQNPPLETRWILEERGLLGKRIAFERACYSLGPDLYDGVRRTFADQILLDGTEVVFDQRLVKSEEERAYMQQAGELADLAITSAARMMRVGMTEFEIAAEMERVLKVNGSEYPAMPIICTRNPRFWGRGMPSEGRIQPDDLFQIELGGCARHYHAVIMRSIFVGEPSPRLRDIQKVVVEAAQAATAAVRPGVPIGDVDRARRKVVDAAGYTDIRIPRCGYGVGLSYPPSWLAGLDVQEDNPLILAAGMTFTLQPGLNLLEEQVSYSIGETVMVTETGCEVLTKCPWELYAGQ